MADMTIQSRDSGESGSSARSFDGPADGINDLSIAIVDAVVQGLFGVGLALTTTRDMIDGPARARLDDAIDLVDQLLRDVRVAAFSQARPHVLRPVDPWRESLDRPEAGRT